MSVAIIDYGSGNLRSVAKAFEKAAQTRDMKVHVSADPLALIEASHIVLPGVGAFADCMAGLTSLPNMRQVLEEQVMHLRKPFLGICVGMQLMFERGLEMGEHCGLGWIKGEVRRLTPKDASLKIPQMGWNDLRIKPDQPMFRNIAQGEHVYFVHSYHAVCEDASDIAAEVDYGGAVVAGVARGNLYGTQFHPEKSQQAGLRIIDNFLSIS